MPYLRFIDNSVDLGSAMTGTYDPALVALSVLIACLGSFATLELADRIRTTERRFRKFTWLATGAVAMGSGVWAMHFIGMLAFSLPLAVGYDLPITLLSMLPAVFAGGVMLYILGRPKLRKRELIAGGTFMGIGIGVMHYIGMAAMRMDAVMRYDPVLFVVSIVVAILLAIIALYVKYLAARRKPEIFLTWTKLGSALVMGLAVACMHYTAMGAVWFFPTEASRAEVVTLNTWYLAVSVGLVTAVIIVLVNVASLVGRRLEVVSLLEKQIAERKRAEEALRDSEARLRNILDHSPTPIYFKDTKGRFLVANSQYEKIYGVKFEDIKGKTLLEIFPGEHVKQFYDHDMAVLKGQETIVREELIDGKTYVTSKFPIQDADGKLIGLGGIETDITDRKKTEEILRQSQKMEAVGQLTGGVAHDFNNLLAVISGNLELAAEARGLDDKTRERLLLALNAVNKGAKLTDQLLTFSRQQTLAPKTINANTQLFDTINLLMQTLGEDIDIKTAFGTHIPLIKVDPGMLGNAILNMALNARDAMLKGGTLTIKTASVDLDGRVLYDNQDPLSGPYVLISISDTGTGIKKKDLEHVFEPFFTTKGVGEGTGMGLSMVYGFVKQSGGHVTIDSKRGKGTTFNLYFPATESLNAETVESATRPMAEAKGTETILVVEDDEDVRQVALEMLSDLGYEVMEAEDGPSALKVLSKDSDSVDLVLSDVIMPSGMSGVDLANELRRHYQDIKILVTSGYPEKFIDKDGIDGSGITLLPKPYKMTDLAEAVRGALDR